MSSNVLPKQSWRIDPHKTALIIVDMQRAFVDPGAPREGFNVRDIVPRMNQLTGICRKVGIPVIFLRAEYRRDLSDTGLVSELRPMALDNELLNVQGRKGADFYPELEIHPNDYIVTKIRFSAFIPGASNLEPLLRGLGRDRFMICGTALEVCVLMTAADAMMLGFRVFPISDLSASASENAAYRDAVLWLLDRNFGKVMTFEEVSSELNP